MPETVRALITGITGQDGSYLAELLLANGYQVHGLIRRSSSINTSRIDHIYQDPHEQDRRLILHYGDMSDSTRLARLINEVRPREVYNLAAQSHVKVSFEAPEYTSDVDALGTLRLLEAIYHCDRSIRFYQASTSELFGSAPPPQNEATPFHPRSPYGVSKTYAYWISVNYREAYGIFAVNGILFNHESPRRGDIRNQEDHPSGRAHRRRPPNGCLPGKLWMRAETGVMRPTTCAQCGLCFSILSRWI